MKMSAKTLEILKSFNNINPSLLFKRGNIVSTIDREHTILAIAHIEEYIPQEFAIYELSKFIGALSAMPDGEITLDEKQLTIKTNNSKIKYTYAEPATIKTSPYKEIPVDNILASFTLEYSALSNIIKVANIMELPDLIIKSDSDSDDIVVYATNEQDPTADSYQVKVGETSSAFKVSFKIENFKLLNRDYNVMIPDGAFVKFQGNDISYWVASKAT